MKFVNNLADNEDFIQEIIGTINVSGAGEEESNDAHQESYRSLNNTDIVNFKTDPVQNKIATESNINIFDIEEQNEEDNDYHKDMERSLPKIDLKRK